MPRRASTQTLPPASAPNAGAGSQGAYLRIGPMMAIPVLMKDLRGDVAELHEQFGLSRGYFDNPENTLPSGTIGRILGYCAEVTGCEYFGLLVGERAGIGALGAVGYLMQSSPTVGTALDILARTLRAHDTGGIALVEHGEGFAAVGYAITAPDAAHANQMLAAALAIVMNILQGLCGAHWRPIEARLAFAAPRNVTPYRKYFGMTPHFDADATLLVFDDYWLARPLPSADPQLHLLMQDRVRQLLEVGAHDLTGQLRRFLRAEATSAPCPLESAARYFGLHSRTFRRRLEAEGASFRRIRDEVRFEASCQMLRHTRMAAGEIASALGYADASVFTRAFSRQAGVGPARWRATVSRDEQPPGGRARRTIR